MRWSLRLWPLRTSLRGVRSEWRLLAVVVAIAVLASTIITSFALLVVATEQGGVRAALSAVSADQRTLAIDVVQPRKSVADARAKADAAIRGVLGGAASTTSVGIAVTSFLPTPALRSGIETFAYFGEFDSIRSNATLASGAWPAPAKAGQPIESALPVAAAKSLKLGIGSEVTVQGTDGPVTTRVVGLYSAKNPRGDYWGRDRLQGTGNDPTFPKENITVYVPTHVFGPLVVGEGTLDAAALPIRSVDIHYLPNFSATRVDQIAPLADRLSTADDDVPFEMGLIGSDLLFSTQLNDVLADVSTGLTVTRSTVVVVILLLLVLSVAALAQSARLFSDARAGERRLMRARGASTRQLLLLATIEALGIGVVSALLALPLASLVYRALAAQPAMVAAGMPAAADATAIVWAVAGGVSLLFVLVLLVPSLGRTELFVDDDQAKGRTRRGSTLARSGLDLGLVVLAVIAVWQLQSYRTPVDGSGSPTIDLLLVAGPAIVLLAGALVAVRLIPAASGLVQRLGSRSRGVVLPLAAWEVGRRSQRATAAVLLLTLALAVGTFGQSFLATWRTSQTDQAALATGAPVRAPAPQGSALSQSARLSTGATGTAQPALRRTVLVAAPGAILDSEESPTGTNATILALTPAARAMIAEGRNGAEGGTRLRTLLKGSTLTPETRVPLPADAKLITASIRFGEAATARAGISVRLRAIVEDANRLLSTIDLGDVAYDGAEHAVSGALPAAQKGGAIAAPLQFVGLQAEIIVSDAQQYSAALYATPATVLVGDIATASRKSETGAALAPKPLAVPTNAKWYAAAADQFAATAVVGTPPRGWQFALELAVPADLATPAIFSVVGWKPVTQVPAVMSVDLQRDVQVSVGISLSVIAQGATIPIQVTGTVPLVPGSTPGAELVPESIGRTDATEPALVVVDQPLLARVLAQSGVSGTMVDEWWIDVPLGSGQAWLDAHPTAAGTPTAQSAEVLARQLEESPLRVATQAALWLAIVAAALLAAIGFAVHATATLRSRRTEFAQLRAIGLSRRRLVGIIGVESALLSVLGVIFGIALGALLAGLVGPIIAISPTGAPPVPAVLLQIPVGTIALLALEVAAVLAAIVVVVAGAQRSADPAGILREGGDS